MSSGSYNQVRVECPFYCGDDGRQRITCEGILEGSSLTLNLKTQDYKIQLREYCCKRYICCEIYRMLMDAKYQEDYDNESV